MTTEQPDRGARAASRWRDLLAVPQMRAVLLAHMVSMTGTIVAQLALSVLVYARTGSSLLSAASLAVGFLPDLLGGTVLSGLADRLPVRRLLVGCDLLSAAVVALMLVPGLPVTGLLLLVLLLGTARPVFGAARSADLAEALPPELWLLARSALRVLTQGVMVGGLALGGLVLLVLRPTQLLAVDALSFVASAVVLRLGTPSRPARAAGQEGNTPLGDARLAVRLLTRRPRLRRLLLLAWLPWAAAAAADGLAVPYSAGRGSGPAGAGLLLASLAAGTVLGELVAARLPALVRRRLVLPLALAMLVPLLGFAASPPLPVAAGLLLLVGLGSCYQQGLDGLVLEETGGPERARVLAVLSAGLMLLQGLGILGAGALAEALPPGPVLALGAAVALALVAMTGYRLRPGATAPSTGVDACPGRPTRPPRRPASS